MSSIAAETKLGGIEMASKGFQPDELRWLAEHISDITESGGDEVYVEFTDDSREDLARALPDHDVVPYEGSWIAETGDRELLTALYGFLDSSWRDALGRSLGLVPRRPVVMGAFEVSQRLRVGVQNLSVTVGLPDPVARLKCGPIWDGREVEAFAFERDRRLGRA